MKKLFRPLITAGIIGAALLTGVALADPVINVTVPERVSTRAYTLSGTVTGATTLKINGQVVNISSSRFIQALTLNEGSNTFTLMATDSANKSATVTKTITVDSGAPVITLDLPASTRLKTFAVAAQLSEAATVKINGQAATKNGVRYEAALTLHEGENSIVVEATDLAGNTASVNKKIVLDTVQPSLDVQLPRLANTRPLVVNGKTEAGATITVNGNTITNTNGLFSTRVNLVEGRNAITVIATDSAGNSTTVTKNVTYDTTKPELSFAMPALSKSSIVELTGNTEEDAIVLVNGSLVPNQNGTFRAKVTLEEAVNTVTVVAVDAAGNANSLLKTVNVDQTGPALRAEAPELTREKTVTISASTEPGATLAVNGKALTGTNGLFTGTVALNEGDNTVLLAAADEAGNTTTISKVITLDTKAPALEVVAPSLTNELTVAVSGTVEDGSTVTVNGQLAAVTNGTFGANVALQPGVNAISVVATDLAGNSTTVTKPVTLDADKPQITFDVPETVKSSSLTVAGRVNKAAAVTVNGERVTLNEGAFTAKLNLKEGPNAVTVTATDVANNTVTVTKPITLDTHAPTLTVMVPDISTTDTVTITGQTETPVNLTLNGQPIPVGNNGEIRTTYQLNQGVNLLNFSAVDKTGNQTILVKTVVYRIYTIQLQMTIGDNKADLNGEQKELQVAPYEQDGTAYVPLRSTADLLGLTVGWDGTTRSNTIIQGDNTINFVPGEKTYRLNGAAREMSAPVVIYQDRSMIPTAMLEALGYSVICDVGANTIEIKK